jgi:single-stranded DNA-binding protein
MNRVFLVGNITADIHFDVLGGRQFLRLFLMSGKPRVLRGLRVVLWDERAKSFYPYLRRGSEIGVFGYLTTHRYMEKLIVEVEATNLILLRNIDWEAGNGTAAQRLPSPSANTYFIVGSVGEDIQFDWRTNKSSEANQASGSERYAFLRMLVSSGEHLQGVRMVTYGALAEVAYPYLRPGSIIAVEGHLQTRSTPSGQKELEVTADHMAFLQNINWAAGDAAQKRVMNTEVA